MPDSIQITVLCFAGLKEKIGQSRISMSLPTDTTCAQFINFLTETYPGTQIYATHLLVARNGQYLNESDLINNNDELACFPPVSGG